MKDSGIVSRGAMSKGMDLERTLQEMLVPVFGAETPDAIGLDAALVDDLGADSLDFVEISCLVEHEFKVVLKTNAMISQAFGIGPEALFSDGNLTAQGAELIRARLGGAPERFRGGMAKVRVFSALTVRDLAVIIRAGLARESSRVPG